jgi:spermidine synthase
MTLQPRATLLYPLFFLSGAAGLGYQMVWLRMLAAGLGHEVPAMIAVTAAFLGGMALGAWCLDRRISQSALAGQWYGGLEFVIGAWGIISAIGIPVVNRLALALTGPEPSSLQQWMVVFGLPLLTLLPATAAIGATLPAMDRFLSPLTANGRCIGALYAANTFGAVAGALGSVFLLMPVLGFRASLLCLGASSIICGVFAFIIQRSHHPDEASSSARQHRAKSGQSAPGPLTAADRPMPFRRLGLTLFLTGFLGIGFELAGVRVLSQVLENTVYTYAAALAAYLIGTAIGASVYQRLGRNLPFRSTLTYLLIGLSMACLAGTHLLALAHPVYEIFRRTLGDGLIAVMGAEMVVAAIAFALPTLFMGATFSHLVQNARSGAGGVGRAGALNTLGCAFAAGGVGVLMLPLLGTKWTLVLIALGYLALLPELRGRRWLAIALPLALAFTLPANLVWIDLPSGGKLREYREGTMASVAVVETADGHRSLRINNRLQMGGTAASLAERRQAHIPLLLHSNPRRALFLGPGTGITLGAAGAYPGLIADGVELVPEVRELMRHFQPENEGPLPKPGINLFAADARRFVRTTTNRYDVIVADLFHPGQDGAGFLYTQEHFTAVRQCLAPGGLFCQWLPLHQLDETGLRAIVAAFMEVFSETHAFLLHFNVDIPVLALIGTPDQLRLASDWFERQAANPDLRSKLRGVGLDREINLLGCLVSGPEPLRRFARNAATSTDDHPAVLFAAPRFSTRRDTQPHELLLTLLERCSAGPKQFVTSVLVQPDEVVAANLAGFIAARDVYLRGLVEEGAGRLPSAIEAYLESARRSLHFTPGYARCVTIIQVMAKADLEQARLLFERLEQAQPAQPLGRKLLGPLFDASTRSR